MEELEQVWQPGAMTRPTLALRQSHVEQGEPVHLVCMGVSGCGKSAIAGELVDRLGWDFAEGDDFHPSANKNKMRAGIPLNDADREPWLDALTRWLDTHASAGRSTISTCSALKRDYRDHLRRAAGLVVFVFLDPSTDVLKDRVQHRHGHFMPATLLGSQLEALEPLAEDEPGVVCSRQAPLPTMTVEILSALETVVGEVAAD